MEMVEAIQKAGVVGAEEPAPDPRKTECEGRVFYVNARNVSR